MRRDKHKEIRKGRMGGIKSITGRKGKVKVQVRSEEELVCERSEEMVVRGGVKNVRRKNFPDCFPPCESRH